MDIKKIRELTRLMRDHDLVEVEVESADLKVKLSKVGPVPAQVMHSAPPAAVAAPQPAAESAPAATPQAPADDESNCKQIVSPIPGTVYLKPNPDTPGFVKVGDTVSDGQVVCLVEAMKVFNEIKCEGMQGTIRKICVEDGQPVEYGSVLFLVD